MYKTIFMMIALAVTTLSFKSDDNVVKFKNDNWSSVVKDARSKDKPIFAMVCANWCSNCARMKSEVFTDPEVAKFMNDHFVSTMIDSEDFKSNIRVSNWGVKAVPTAVFMTSDKKIVHMASGYRSPDRLLEEAQKALDDM